MTHIRAPFDTRIDTLKIFVPMTVSFKKRNYVNRDGLSPIYLHVSSNGDRARIHLDIWVKPQYWNQNKQCLVGPAEEIEIENLLIDNIKSKVTEIKTFYKLSGLDLTKDEFLKEFKNNLPRTNFVSYFRKRLEDRSGLIENSTWKKEEAIWNKLQEWQPEIYFKNIDDSFFDDFRAWLAKKGNNKTTRNANVKVVKKYLTYAVKSGVKLRIDLDGVVCGPTKGHKTYLNSSEVQKLFDYYYSSHITPTHKLCLGYFLFSCFTGLRASDIHNQTRPNILKGYFSFVHVKTKKQQIIRLNQRALSIANECPELFVKFYSKGHIRRTVQEICKFFGISKKVDYHTSRHTFGTNFILLGGEVTKLMILMNHSDIKETMIYVHLAELEKNAEADIMDRLVS